MDGNVFYRTPLTTIRFFMAWSSKLFSIRQHSWSKIKSRSDRGYAGNHTSGKLDPPTLLTLSSKLSSMAGLAIMLDNAFGIFNNVLPRFQWAEINLSFPSDDKYFKTANYEELIAYSPFPQRKMKVKDAFLCLFSPPDRSEDSLRTLILNNPTALDMQMLIHCLYTVSLPLPIH